ncbi:hypothetical protein [Photobacterium iliopiscarium]|uniref:hypothetical protein n=1 Tax=Photobacterium iliopiscarium TaxID=56192 RepID=UPI001E329160|nr:hypothetical protein [Photobacterium iliopiscarium]MCD9467052.1 hypothetical protein [Photobacterium iliopiscarium]MCD9487011.1 hypothetical protein [Photobacterium iliopiscarium]MCF2243562.1 hypothetical protein [Photobacterium iliopiscarium]
MNHDTFNQLKEMIVKVATALGPDILSRTAFVGGVTTGLLLTDDLVIESVRATDDVDLIIGTIGYPQQIAFEESVRELGFTDRTDNDVICRKWLGEIQVDFMPIDGTLGFENRWYPDALANATEYDLTDEITIRLLTPAYFLGTKFEAYNGRGGNDLLSSRDIEDIVNLINGRDPIVQDIRDTENTELINYISEQLDAIGRHEDFEYVLQSATRGDDDRIDIIYERVQAIQGLIHD